MVFLGLNIFERMSTRVSGTSTTAVWTSKRPAEAVVGVLPRVRALNMVVLPDWGNPMIPSFMFSFYIVGRTLAPSASTVLIIRLNIWRDTIPPHEKFSLALLILSGILWGAKEPKWRNR